VVITSWHKKTQATSAFVRSGRANHFISLELSSAGGLLVPLSSWRESYLNFRLDTFVFESQGLPRFTSACNDKHKLHRKDGRLEYKYFCMTLSYVS
jgi:hypothetical protein